MSMTSGLVGLMLMMSLLLIALLHLLSAPSLVTLRQRSSSGWLAEPLHFAGDLNADPGFIPCLANGIATGKFIGLALAHSFLSGKEPDATCKFQVVGKVGTRTDFMIACPNALAASVGCRVSDRWFVPHFSLCGV